MRFLLGQSPEQVQRARPPVRWFLVFAALVVLGAAAQRGLAGGLTPAGVLAHYLGPDGTEPLSQVALWEELHVNAFVYGFLLLTLGSLLVASPVSPRLASGLLGAACGSALADLAAPFAVVAARGLGALRVATFAATAALLLAAVAVSWARYGRLPRVPDA